MHESDIDKLRTAVEQLKKRLAPPEQQAVEKAREDEKILAEKITLLISQGYTQKQAIAIISVTENTILRFEVMKDVAHRLRISNYESLSDPFRPPE